MEIHLKVSQSQSTPFLQHMQNSSAETRSTEMHIQKHLDKSEGFSFAYINPLFLVIHYSDFSESLPPCNSLLPHCFQFVNNVKQLCRSRLAVCHALIMNSGSRHEQNRNNSV